MGVAYHFNEFIIKTATVSAHEPYFTVANYVSKIGSILR